MKYLFFLLAFLYACSAKIEQKQAALQKDILPSQESIQKNQEIKKTTETLEKVEEEEDSEDSEKDIYAAAHKLHSIFKIKTQGLLYQHKNPIYILLQKREDGKTEIILKEMLSPAGEKPIKVGQEWERYLLSDKVTILENQREFWFDLQGNIDFTEEDKIFDAFDNPPQADIILVPIDAKDNKKGMLDITKKKTQISIYAIE